MTDLVGPGSITTTLVLYMAWTASVTELKLRLSFESEKEKGFFFMAGRVAESI